jgi:hypothetical protein
MSPLTKRHDLLLAAAAALAGVVFFSSLGWLWPLANADLNAPRDELTRRAREALAARGFDAGAYDAAVALTFDDAAVDYLEKHFGRDYAQSLVQAGSPLVNHVVSFKKRGEANSFAVWFGPDGSLIGWSREMQEDEPADAADEETARAAALAELAGGLRVPVGEYVPKGVATRERPARTDRTFTFERTLSESPELRERAAVTVAGTTVVYAGRAIVVPGAALREQRAAEAAPQALWSAGIVLLSIAVVGAFWIFLVRLRNGTARLGRAAVWSTVVFVCAFGTNALKDSWLMASWDPLWPRWVSTLRSPVFASQDQVWTFLMLFALVSAGDALDRESGASRGASLWALGRGRLRDPAVGAAIWRGFAVGLICGATIAVSVWLLDAVAGARTSLQPRGMFFFAINSAAPAVSILLFFTNVALLEELGYRYFCGAWLLGVTGRKWLAILLPAIVYGLTHTTLDFLPPAEPFWGRAVVMTLVGCVWGWAFFRYDALTVVMSHLMADLFIFNWPRLASGEPALVTVALLTMGFPLLLALPSAGARNRPQGPR